jgi:hypothetical protein
MVATLALGIPHTPWIPERVLSLTRLVDALSPAPPVMVARRVFGESEPNWSWAGKLWTWATETNATHLLQLQDDVVVGPEFWQALSAMVEAVPDQVIGLETVHPFAESLYRSGGTWLTTRDGLIGVGYVFPVGLLREFLRWRAETLRPNAVQQANEDQLIGIWTAATRRRVWHPVPTIIDHDTEISSTYGNDAHTHRRPVVTTVRGADWYARWDALPASREGRVPEGVTRGIRRSTWSDVSRAVHIDGTFYRETASLCRRWVKNFTVEDMAYVRGPA